MRMDTTTGPRRWRRLVAGLGIAVTAVLSSAACAGDDAGEDQITDVDDTEAPVNPTVEPVE
ncbi:hypothetical protein A7K94_0201000 [Modestobacter sp. VKM Ac-2676]|nr:hypothetical protein A7K94_0201000 [Modestobacter sp. VKM Ac-2676]